MIIDLHTHTTASDGRDAPDALVARAAASGVAVVGVTDHDTIAGLDAARRSAANGAVAVIPGIEMTAVVEGADVHVLGYFIDSGFTPLLEFLDAQRKRRLDRVRAMADRLAGLGIPLDVEEILGPAIADPGRAAGRPWLARALVAAGHAADTNEAFARWLGRGQPAFIPRVGAEPREVIERIHDAGGVASLAHPGLTGHDEAITRWVDEGLDAIEAYHTDHDAAATDRYVMMAGRLGVLVTGGSDYHGDEKHGGLPGSVSLPEPDYERLLERAGV